MGKPEPRLGAATVALFSATTLILALGLIELSARLYYAVRGNPSSVELHAYWMDDATTGYSLKPGYANGGIRVNSLGFRGPEVSTQKPAAASARIIALGDSTTFGPREQECAYPYLLPDLLRLQSGASVEVINAGVEGYRSDRALAHLERDVLPLHPDLVTVLIGWNDLYGIDPRTDAENIALVSSPIQRALSWSAAAQTVRRIYFERLQPPFTPMVGTSPGRPDARRLQSYRPGGYAERLHRIIESIRSTGAEVTLLTWPTLLDTGDSAALVSKIQYPYHTRDLATLRDLYAAYQAVLRQVAGDMGVSVVDAASVVDNNPGGSSLFTDTIHFTCAGHELVANAVAPVISRQLEQRKSLSGAANASLTQHQAGANR